MPIISPTAISPHRIGFDWSSYWKTRHPEIATFDAGLTTPLSEAQIIKLGEMLDTLKTGMGITSLTDAFDFLYLHGWVSEEVGLHNLVKNAHHATNHDAVWALGGGFTGDAIGKYIDTNYNPSTQGVNYTLNDAGFGIYVTTDRSATSLKQHGGYIVGGFCVVTPHRSYGDARGAINYGSIDCIATVGAKGSVGLTSVYRNTNVSYLIRDKDDPAYAAEHAPSAIYNYNLLLLARGSVVGAAEYFDDVQILFSYAGKGLTQAQHNALYDALYGFFLT